MLHSLLQLPPQEMSPTFETIIRFLNNLTDEQLESLDEQKYTEALFTLYHGT